MRDEVQKKLPMVNCPTCGELSPFSPENEWRPFCCARCKQVDFGAWASEDFRVAGKIDDLDPSELSDLHSQVATRH